MEISDFRIKIELGKKLIIENKPYEVKGIIKFRLDDESFYIKCYLSNNYVFADDEESNSFLLVKETKTLFNPPFEKKLTFKNKKFNFLYSAHAKAENVKGEATFKEGDSETFWDYSSDDNSYLSLGIIDSSNKRLDLYGKIIKINDVNIE